MLRRAIGVLMGVFLLAGVVFSQVVINEVQTSNVSTLADEFNEYPDWLELLNVSSNAVNLDGWYLSDKRDSLDRWRFPAITLLPSQYLLVSASGRDIKQQPSYWHTIIDSGDEWKFLVPGDTVSSLWMSTQYSDINWNVGSSGFGYADGDDRTEVPFGTTSIFTRKTFTVSSLDNITSILLHVDYDDGFVAYLNGVEVARANLGDAGTPVAYHQFASPDREALLYQGQQPSVFDITAFKNAMVPGENLLAVQVHNVSTTSSDLSLITFLTLRKSSVNDASEKPSSYLNLGNALPHTNFKLKSEGGETIILSNPLKQVADSVNIPPIQPGMSYGRPTSDINSLAYFYRPTPGTVNETNGYNALSNDIVNYSVPGGFRAAGFQVKLSNAAGYPVYYTTDGSEPSEVSTLYTLPINVSSNIVVRSRVIRSGYLPGRVYSSTYYTSRKHDMPVVCLSTEPANLWDYYTGMYVMGPNAQTGNPYFGANFWMDWEKPFSVEIYSSASEQMINQLAGAKIFGAWSRAREQKSFSLFARKDYGVSGFNWPIFDKRELASYKSVVLRNAGNDWDLAFIRDGVMTDITAHLGIEHQAFQPVVAYLNSEYWGIYNLREKVNEDFLSNYSHGNPDDIIILENDAVVVEGSNAEYLALRNYLNSNSSLATDEKYAFVSNRVDIDNFIKYQLVQIYFDNTDWPGNNIKYWKTTAPNSKWRWILYDTDFGLGLYNSNSFTHNTLQFALEPSNTSWPNPAWSTLVFRRLITNTGFRNNFINQMADNINTTFEPENVARVVDSIYKLYIKEMPYHKQRWGQNYTSWVNEVQRIKTWAYNRPDNMLGFVQSKFNLAAQRNITLEVSEANSGKIRLNSITPAAYPFNGTYFQGVPIEMEALPAPGYKFVRWEGQLPSTENIINYNPVNTAKFKAVFEKASGNEVQLIVNEINFNSSPEYPTGDWVEIFNAGPVTVNLDGFLLSDANPDSGFVFPSGTILYPGKYLVVAKNPEKFLKVNPLIANCIGGFDFGIGSSGDKIRLYDSDNKVLDAIDFLTSYPWPDGAKIGTGNTLELKLPSLDNTKPENWVAVKPGGTPGMINSGAGLVNNPELTLDSKASPIAFPNRFNDYTTITFSLSAFEKVKIDIIDMQGRVVANLLNGCLPAGEHSTDWLPDNKISCGMYIVRFVSDTISENINVVFLK
ncbi:MAG: CotH kinase family protein [Bacteroidales bacterium]|nr:CotH kinase family protein [Bacteroidales bacterium]